MIADSQIQSNDIKSKQITKQNKQDCATKWNVLLLTLSLILGAETLICARLLHGLFQDITKAQEEVEYGEYPVECLYKFLNSNSQAYDPIDLETCDLLIQEFDHGATRRLQWDMKNFIFDLMDEYNVSQEFLPSIHVGAESDLRQLNHLPCDCAKEISTHPLRWNSIDGQVTEDGLMRVTPDGEVIVPQDGLYFVYAQVYFQMIPSQPTRGELFFFQTIYKRTTTHTKPIPLAKARESPCLNVTLNTQVFSSHQGALFNLHKGDKLFLAVQGMNAVSLLQDSTYFGAFMACWLLGEFESTFESPSNHNRCDLTCFESSLNFLLTMYYAQMQGNRGPRPDQQNHAQRRPNHQDQQRRPGGDSNGQHSDNNAEPLSANAGITIDLQNFRKPGEKTYTQRSRLFVGNLPTGVSEQEVEKLFLKYGKPSEIFINKDRGFGFIRLETKTMADIAKAELDNTQFRGRQIRVRFATHGAALTVKNLPQFVSNELLEEAFSIFGQVERAIVIVDDRGRPTGKGIVEFTSKPAARKALDRCTDGAFLLTSFPRPLTVEPMDQFDEDEGLPEKLVNKNQQYHKEREQPPRFAQPGSFEYEYAMRWKALLEMEKQQFEQVDRNIKEAQEKLEAEMEAAQHEHQVMLMRQDLMRRQEELRRMEEMHSQEVQKRKQLELRQEEERRRREEDMRLHNEEMMRRQQETGFKGGNFPENQREQDMRIHMQGPGMNRNQLPGNAGSTAAGNNEGGAGLMGNPPMPIGGALFPRGPPGPADFGHNKRRRF